MKNDVINAIETRRSTRAFSDELIPKDTVDLLCRAALQAPSAMNRQPCQVIALSNKGLINELEKSVVDCFKTVDMETYKRITETRNGKVFYDAPLVIIISVENNSMMDAGIAVQNVALAATSLKYGSVILGLPAVAFKGEVGDKWKEKLRFKPGNEYAIAIAVGRSADTKEPHEIDLSQIVKIY